MSVSRNCAILGIVLVVIFCAVAGCLGSLPAKPAAAGGSSQREQQRRERWRQRWWQRRGIRQQRVPAVRLLHLRLHRVVDGEQ